MGMISCLGLTLAENWENLKAGKSGIREITHFDPSHLQTRIAGQVPDGFDDLSRQYIRKRQAGQMTRVTRMCVTAARMAVADAGLDFQAADRHRCGVIIGVVNTGNSSVEKDTTLQNTVLKSMTNSMPAWISLDFQLTGPNFAVNTACASSAYAIAIGFDLIRSGTADIIIAGGADSIINPEEIAGFNAIYALSTSNDPPWKASKPFSRDRDGFVIGEGAGVLILESLEHARKRKAVPYAELAGHALTSEGYNMMAPLTDGAGMALTMEKAIADSGIWKSDVDYINAHGTSTELNDRFETTAIKTVFGERAYQIPVSSTKSMIGHTIGAAGALEAITTVMALKHGIIPPTINYDNSDPDLDLDYVPNHSRERALQVAISNSFGFGGHNATLVFKRTE
jgi:3-oxoacyl-[acyl-carrier-protein] synthase II